MLEVNSTENCQSLELWYSISCTAHLLQQPTKLSKYVVSPEYHSWDSIGKLQIISTISLDLWINKPPLYIWQHLYLSNKCATWNRYEVSSQRSEATGSSAEYVSAEGIWSWNCGTAWPEDVDSWQPSPAPPWWSGSSVLGPGAEPPYPGSTGSQPQIRLGHDTLGTCCECQIASHNAARCQSS